MKYIDRYQAGRAVLRPQLKRQEKSAVHCKHASFFKSHTFTPVPAYTANSATLSCSVSHSVNSFFSLHVTAESPLQKYEHYQPPSGGGFSGYNRARTFARNKAFVFVLSEAQVNSCADKSRQPYFYSLRPSA